MATPYLGSRVSLISSSEVRYEGILYTIDPKESTVALQSVKCCGTEDRAVQNGKKIPASDTVYEFIIFKGENIKHLHVTDTSKVPPDDPAIMNVIERPMDPPRQREFGGRKPQQWTLSSPQRNRGYERERRPAPEPRNQGAPRTRDSRRGQQIERTWYNEAKVPRDQRDRDPRDRDYGSRRNQGYGYDDREDRGDYRPRRRQDRYNGRRDYNRGGYDDGYRGYNNRNQDRNGRYRDNRRPRDSRNNSGGGGNRKDLRGKEGKGEYLALGDRSKRNEIQIDKNAHFDFDAANQLFSNMQIKEDADDAGETQEQKNEVEGPTDVAKDDAGDEPQDVPATGHHQLGQDVEPQMVKYDKTNSFFDDLSTDRSVRQNRKSRNEQRAADKEAFGDVAQNYQSKHQRRRYGRNRYNNRRGGYRGRGGGRGRGRGRRWQNRQRPEQPV